MTTTVEVGSRAALEEAGLSRPVSFRTRSGNTMPRRLWMATLAALLGLTSVGLPTLAQGDRPIAVFVSSHANVDLGDVAVGRVRERVITLSLESGEGARWSSFVFDPYGPFDYFHVPVHALPRNTGPHGTDVRLLFEPPDIGAFSATLTMTYYVTTWGRGETEGVAGCPTHRSRGAGGAGPDRTASLPEPWWVRAEHRDR
jgi:hypothetical protein